MNKNIVQKKQKQKHEKNKLRNDGKACRLDFLYFCPTENMIL